MLVRSRVGGQELGAKADLKNITPQELTETLDRFQALKQD